MLSATVLAIAQLLTVSIAPNAPFVTPNAVAVVQGVEWTNYNYIGALDGEPTLGGYSVTLGGLPCGIRSIAPTAIVFIVPAAIEPGTRTLVVSGPTGVFSTNVEVRAFHPILREQGGYAVASTSATMVPVLYLNGEPVPVSPMTWNYMSLQTIGIPPNTDATVILDGPEHYEIPARVWEFPSFPGITNTLFYGPPCANGFYRVSIEVGGIRSAPSFMRFTSKCEVFARPERTARVR